MTVEELTREVLSLAPADRAAIAYYVISSLDEAGEDVDEDLFAREVERRYEDAVAGTVPLVPIDAVFARAKAAAL